LTLATAAPYLAPLTGQPVSVTQTHLPGLTALTWLRVAAMLFQNVDEASSMDEPWKYGYESTPTKSAAVMTASLVEFTLRHV